MLKNGTILMINEMAQEGKSAYAISVYCIIKRQKIAE